MTLAQFMDQLELTLAKAEEGPPEGLRPRGTFVGHPPKETISGIIVEAPDGSRFYVLAWEDQEQAEGKRKPRRPRRD